MKKNNLLKVLGIMLALIMAFTMFTACGSSESGSADAAGSDEVTNLVIAHVEVEDRGIHQAFVKFADQIAEESGGSLTAEVHPNAELGDDTDVLESIQMGTIAMTACSPAIFETYNDKLAVLSLPYLFSDQEGMDVAYNGDFAALLEPLYEEANFKALCYNYDGARCVSNNSKEIKTPADMEGLKFRVMDSPLYIQMFKCWGANPTPMGYSEIYTALQQGTIDGQDNPPGLTYGSKFNEVTKYFSTTQHVFQNCPVIIGLETFNALTADQQAIVVDAAKAYCHDWQREEEMALEEDYINKIEEDGTQVYRMTAEEKAAFEELVQPVYDSYRESLGDDFINEVLAACGK